MGRLANSRGYEPDIAIPPGETLLETIEGLGMTQSELASRLGRPVKTVNEIIKAKAGITPQTAIELEQVLGAPAQFWLRLEMDYQATQARLREREGLEKDIPLLHRFPYAEMAKLGWVEPIRDKVARVMALRSFLGVAELRNMPRVALPAFRKSQGCEASAEALSTWLRKGELEARNIDTDAFDKKAFKKALQEIRGLTRCASIGAATKRMVELCAGCGVALVFVPHLRRTYANGATWWPKGDKALIQLSIRNRYEDVFWFTFFHECGHILLHGKREQFIDMDKDAPDEKEKEADRFAMEMLLPAGKYEIFVKAGLFSMASVRSFAKEMDVSPAVVVGRLQHDKHLGYNQLHGLRRKLDWKKAGEV